MGYLILMRHGESVWNLKNLFTGWVDVPLSQNGIEEALQGGEQIRALPIDIVYTSTLIRAQMTAMLALSRHSSQRAPVILHDMGRKKEWGVVSGEVLHNECIPVICSAELNERMYGELQGFNKDEMREKYGAEQVHIWRRSYSTPPPKGESLQDTAARAIPYFEKEIVPKVKEGKSVFVAAHGNSLRAIIKSLDRLSEEEVVKLELGTGVPICYTFSEQKFVRDTPPIL